MVAALLAAMVFAPPSNVGASGLDPSFGEGGISVVTPPPGYSGEEARALTADQSGRLVVAGTTENEGVLVRRYLANGSPDPSFDGNGRVETSLGNGAAANAVTVLRGGDILVAGGAETALALVRYRPDGSRALSFGRRGHVVTRGGSGGAAALALGVQASGRIISGGYKISPSGSWTGLVVGYRGNGSVDGRFAGGGQAELHSSPRTEVAISGIEIQPDGKILVGGDVGGRLMLGRLRADGQPDRSFGGGDGIVLIDADGDRRCACSFANAMTIAPGGRPVLAGIATGRDGESALLVRFNRDGRLDRGFGRRGVVRARRGARLVFNGVAARADGRITVAGFYVQPGSAGSQVSVFRYLPSGKLDASFAQGGFYHRRVGLSSVGSAVISQPDGRTVVAGQTVFPAEKLPEGGSLLSGSRVLLMRFRS